MVAGGSVDRQEGDRVVVQITDRSDRGPRLLSEVTIREKIFFVLLLLKSCEWLILFPVEQRMTKVPPFLHRWSNPAE